MQKLTERIIIFIALLSSVSSHAQLLSADELDSTFVYSSLEEALQNPQVVYRLNLTKHKLKDFPQDIFQFANLNELVLDRNRIVIVPDEIAGLKYLQKLSISRNALDTLSPAICSLENLRYLNVGDNYITGIPEEIENLKQLNTFILWQNPVEFFPTEIGMLENLKELDILHIDLNAEEQDDLRNILPNCVIHFSPPCNCYD
ncbi:MAG: hypothetical protein SH856_07245 [Flavobacteriales bacterium]|nr:hypothetical protein [Flavobacteriales bacterium]